MNIGIVGTDSSHADAFSGIINSSRTGVLGDVTVSHIWGRDRRTTEKTAVKNGIHTVVSDPRDMAAEVDCVMILLRYAKDHVKYAVPFLERGMTVWVDKPFAASASEASMLADCAQRHQAFLCGGSTCKYIPAIERIRQLIHNGRYGVLTGAAMSFAADKDSPYGGVEFYGSHLVEMCLAAFGSHYSGVESICTEHAVSSLVCYPDFQVRLNFIKDNPTDSAELRFKNQKIEIRLDISDCYRLGIEAFVSMLKGEYPHTDTEFLVRSVSLMEDIKQAVAHSDGQGT